MTDDFMITIQLEKLHQNALAALTELLSFYAKLPKTDPRTLTAMNIKSVISSTRLMKISFDEHIHSLPTEWFQQ